MNPPDTPPQPDRCPQTKFRSLTDRQYLITNNVFVLVCSLYQCVVGLGIVLAFNHNFRKSSGSAGISNVEERNAGTQSYMAQCIIGGYLTIISIMGIRAAHKVNIQVRGGGVGGTVCVASIDA
jgi:hypothetical protein